MRQVPQKNDRALIATLLVYLGIIIFLSFRHLGPVYLSDEIGYAAKAAHLAGQSNLLSSSWHAGYSMAIAPLFKIFGIGTATWISIALLNLALLVLSILFWISTLRKLGLSAKHASWASVSSLVCYGVWGFTGWLFVNPMLQLIIAMLGRWLLIEKKQLQLIAIAITGGLAYWVHPTGALIAGCAWLTTLLTSFSDNTKHLPDNQRPAKEFIGIVSGILLTLALFLIYKHIHGTINISMGGDGGHYSKQASGYIAALKEETLQTSLEIFTGFINGIANLSIATFGYGALLASSLLHTPNGATLPTSKHKAFTIQGFIITTTIVLLLFSAALSIDMDNNYQHMLHQRYISPMIQSLWVLGIASCMGQEDIKNFSTRIAIAISPVLLAIITGSILWNYDKTFSLIDLMSSGSSVIANRIGSQQEALSGLGIGALIIVAVQALRSYPKLIFAGIITSIVGFESNLMRSRSVQSGSTPRALIKRAETQDTMSNICLAAVRTPLSTRESDNIYEFYLSSPRIKRIINRYHDRSDYNSFFDPDSSNCQYIIAPLDISLRDDRDDVRLVISKLAECNLDLVDDQYGWGLYKCADKSKPVQSKGSRGFTTISNNTTAVPPPNDMKPLRIYTKKAFRHEKSALSYARVTAKENSDYVIESCDSINIKNERRQCRKKKVAIISDQSNTPLLWGIYIDSLKTGSYKLFMPGLQVVKGSIRIEIVDENTERLSSEVISQGKANNPLIFSIPSDDKKIEIRIEADEGASFKNPSHIIIGS